MSEPDRFDLDFIDACDPTALPPRTEREPPANTRATDDLFLRNDRSEAAMSRIRYLGGEDGFDMLASNAGIAQAVSGPIIAQLVMADWKKWQDSPLTAAFLVTRACVPMLRLRNGAIVFTASTRTIQSEPNSDADASAKGGLLAMTHALAVSPGPDVRVDAVRPSWIETGPYQKPFERSDPDHRDRDIDRHPVSRIRNARRHRGHDSVSGERRCRFHHRPAQRRRWRHYERR